MSAEFHISMEEMLHMKDAEISSLIEQLVAERIRREAAEREADEAYKHMMSVTRQLARFRQHIDSWADIAEGKAHEL
jgi:hypothetical protein